MNSKVSNQSASLGLFLTAHSIIGQSVIEELESIKYHLSNSDNKLSKQQKNQLNNINSILNQHSNKIFKLYKNNFIVNEKLTIQTGIDIENLICYCLNDNLFVMTNISSLFVSAVDFIVPKKFVTTFTVSQRKELCQTNIRDYYHYFLFKLFFEYNKQFKGTVWNLNLNQLNQLLTYYNNICDDKQLLSNINEIIKFISILDVNKLMLFYELVKLKLHVKTETLRK